MVPNVRIVFVGCDAGDVAVIASVAAAHCMDLRVLAATDRLVAEILAEQPDAVILDVAQRGDADGYEVCARLKANPSLAGVPVILITSLDGPEPRRRAYAAGCDDYMEKPFNRAELAHRVGSYARLRRAWKRSF
jgi:CheY-like chemotaxis protein